LIPVEDESKCKQDDFEPQLGILFLTGSGWGLSLRQPGWFFWPSIIGLKVQNKTKNKQRDLKI
jgi:hypothetical protein